ncbi:MULTISPECIES: aminotransferase class I/II-fold pyridoxal phosphate-dependent enzyme [unclassified Polaribacter]|uniref:aminotransferase class I/II-fold pyridoxal phosphate-dependent enzyme n=1 Tax=unclassified Polaribacter TaxID=196858 RepID=UPI0011BDA8E8|nr:MULTISPECIES: aminotransferase class I/II-fold pyridoxal phosphate-dependent enzyme [unclassified Polaribacter]TXD52113.1 aminotransferase class I/II-fold pyridoxal phosphate-dependent enzyme [Polaribacter sp. IC063]TXD59967.1 aminotransferase class I/II-fold pyridoxal phosphate-dependent enzyme [Polaribacter sp. IC066]
MIKIQNKSKSSPYYNIGQLRIDYWNKLKIESSELSRCNHGSENEKTHKEVVKNLIKDLKGVECYFASPGIGRMLKLEQALSDHEHTSLSNLIAETTKDLVGDSYRSNPDYIDYDEHTMASVEDHQQQNSVRKNHFEVLFVDDISEKEELILKQRLMSLRTPNDKFTYGVTVQRSFQDAMIALHFNHNIQAVIVRYAPTYRSKVISPLIKPYIQTITKLDYSSKSETDLGPLIGELIHQLRPELDAYYVTDTSLGHLKDSTLKCFRRIFYQTEDIQELHLTILLGIDERFETPFFSALVEYSKKPTGVFHAMPIARGNSVFKSRWINDFGDFYGRNMFLAETSATTGGLDSLLQPTGPLKKAQEMARDAYGSQHTYFVTNGTSTANKIVMQALVEPGNVVLIDRDCHKSHHYGLVLVGAYPVYLDSYPIEKYSIYGAVPLEQIKGRLLELKKAGRLDKVKTLLLTNCTFDGMVYNVERVMEEVLAIKPDMIFLWDEAWFAFARFANNYKQRTGMYVAEKLYNKYKSIAYKKKYTEYNKGLKEGEISLMPNPDKVRIRVYSTQSTHKTLSSFRQGSMIHIWDQDFRRKSENTFLEAYMTHTSTSPNYQMLASLDAGRRQVQLEGFELVEKSIEMAMVLRAKINDNPQLSKYFDILTVKDFIPNQYRQTGLKEYYSKNEGWNLMDDAWEQDEFVLDPTKITLHIGKTGIDGDTFKNKYLMDKFNIQINKTSRNTVLFLTNIGTTRGSITYLTNALLKIADELDEEFKSLNNKEMEIRQKRIYSLTKEVPPLPDFSFFHHSFQAVPGVPGGDLRAAYFLAYKEKNYEYIPLNECLGALKKGKVLVASTFVIPYPPGFPVLVPGQVVSEEIINFMNALDVSEIHGYRADLGLRIFTESVLDRHKTTTSLGGMNSEK